MTAQRQRTIDALVAQRAQDAAHAVALEVEWNRQRETLGIILCDAGVVPFRPAASLAEMESRKFEIRIPWRFLRDYHIGEAYPLATASKLGAQLTDQGLAVKVGWEREPRSVHADGEDRNPPMAQIQFPVSTPYNPRTLPGGSEVGFTIQIYRAVIAYLVEEVPADEGTITWRNMKDAEALAEWRGLPW